ncbi:RloB family protein [Myroides sp. WP-1]|uniref:RloB family protein n=1 Tax=Myroides sp. WP-1 TaxID=2759944 RepID=UPI0015FC3F22|nr:RloB family protein [Myroides sp. WP-1]MBB1140751.1 RloB domain-containing protein [Myroides sp. WP-1]
MPKKTKAIKDSDKTKAWNRKKKPTPYRVETIAIKKTILIVCEGQTEKLYFESFPVYGVKVEAIDLGGQSKTKLVETTVDIINGTTYTYDEVWCVFDMDYSRGAQECADFDNAINKAIQLGYKVAYSNDSFELWFYLHYHKTEARQLRSFYYDQLSKKMNVNYEKDGKKYGFCQNIYRFLAGDKEASQSRAIKFAEELYNSQIDLPYHQQNPVTTVFMLVQSLNENLRQ